MIISSSSRSDVVDESSRDGVRSVLVTEVSGNDQRKKWDQVAVEEPLAIQLIHGPLRDRSRTTISVTMRTPGQDADLAAGLLLSEGVIHEPDQVLAIEAAGANVVRVDLHPDVPIDYSRLDRRGYTSSSCGVCGKRSIEAVELACEGPRAGGPPVRAAEVHSLPERLREAQPAFAWTGGLHAAAFFDSGGHLLSVREDVGRHNAVDKLIGAELRAGRLPLAERILFVSGRASFELVQKAAIAGVPLFAAVGAPSSLAIDLALRLGVTLIGFVRGGRFNIYAGAERIAL
jgi:FdhD protein